MRDDVTSSRTVAPAPPLAALPGKPTALDLPLGYSAVGQARYRALSITAVVVAHVAVAWGRDFGDVSPLRGVILGGAEHQLAVTVLVVPAD